MKHSKQVLCKQSKFLLLCLLVTALKPQAQSIPKAQEPVSAALGRYTSQRLQEKLFVHTDKDFYLAGEICWFKLYAIDAGSHHPLALSKIAYLEWLDQNNQPVLQTKIGLSDGHGDGSLYLPPALHSGNYKLRAYTSWMKNYGADWFFEKEITIINGRSPSTPRAPDSVNAPANPAPAKDHVDFFPEGGNLVGNIPGKIAFRVTDQYGKGIECDGFVTEDNQDTVARFRPYLFGIGSFKLTPRPGHQYRSTIRLTDGTILTQLLPAVYKEGLVMNISREDSNRIRVNVQSTSTGDAGIYLIAQTRQSVTLAQSIVLKEGKASLLLDRNSFGDGISQLTLFNAARQPVCERLVFFDPIHPMHLTVSADKNSYSTRKKISLAVSSTDNSDKPLPADCSIAVFRADSLQTIPADNICSYLWLNSDLKGKIESPGYYLDHPEDAEAMDNLMLSHGWRRFRWEEVLRNTGPSFDFPPEYNGAIISGKVVDTRTGAAPAKKIQLYLSVPGTRTQFTSSIPDSTGRVRFELKDFCGGQEIIVQTKPEDSLVRVDIANPFSDHYSETLLRPVERTTYDPAVLTDKNVAVQVLNRYAGVRLKQFRFPAVDTNTFYYKPDYSYRLDDYTRFTTMEEVLREYVRYMQVRKKASGFQLPLFDISNNRFFEKQSLILLDGVPVFNTDSLMAMDPLKIRKLDMIHHKFFLGGVDFDGIMNWVTYKGDLGGYLLDPHVAVIDYEGLQLQREFYSPSYATDDAAASHLPDFRNVLYWAPGVATDSGGKNTLEFYSSDLPGRYAVVLQGIAADGRPGKAITWFEVK